MSLKLVAPKQGRTPYWRVRGTYLGCYLHRSTGTSEKALAKKLLEQFKREIERSAAEPQKIGTGFAAAAAAYMRAGGDNRFLAPLIKHFSNAPLEEIDQVRIDNAAAEIYPHATPATRNRQVYTPMAAVLRRAGIEKSFKRPLGSRSPKGVSWLRPEQAFAVFAAADAIDAEFGLFLRLLCYTGMRLSEAVDVRISQLEISGDSPSIYLPKTKNSEARRVHLTPELVAALASHPRGLERPADDWLIRFHISGHLRNMLADTMRNAGVSFPPRQCGFHIFRHTWATWMRKFAGLDTSGLLETGAWRDRTSAARYEHLDATEEARKADLLPTARRK
jgi:integrase